ncbi:MAG: DNA circularization N-terminal domain-containing protein [Nannocystaceae bacterium]
MTATDDVFSKLPKATWRGITVPLASKSASFQQGQSRHRYVFKDGELVESLGAENWQFTWQIPFRQGINRRPYLNLFTEVYPRFLDAVRDREPGVLFDPVLGEFRCKVVSFEETTDVNRRDGVDVSVTFVEAPEPNVVVLPGDDLTLIDGVGQDVAALDQAIPVIFSSYQIPPPEPNINPLDAAGSLFDQVALTGNKLVATAAKYESQLAKFEDSLRSLDDVKLAPVIRSVQRTRARTARIAVTPPQPIIKSNPQAKKTVEKLIADLGIAAETDPSYKLLVEIGLG